MTLGNYFISPADGVSNDRGGAQPTRPRTPPSARLEPPEIAPVTEGSAADAPGSHPRAPGARPRTIQARRALRTRGVAGAGNARDSPAARPSSAAGLPPHRPWGPGRPSGGLGQAWRSSAVPPTYPHPLRRGSAAGKGKGGAVQAAVRRQPRLLFAGQPQNHALPKFKSPRHCGSARSHPLRGAPSGQTGHTGGCRTAAAPLSTGHSAAQPSCPGCTAARAPHGDTAPGAARRRDAPGMEDDTTTDGAAGEPSPRCQPPVPDGAVPAAPAPARSLRRFCGGAPRAARRACRPDGGGFPLPPSLHPSPPLPPYLFQR